MDETVNLAPDKRLLGKPLLLDVLCAHRKGVVRYLKNGTALVKVDHKKFIHVPKSNQYDLTQATIFGLNERLTMSSTSPHIDKKGRTLRHEFNSEWGHYEDALIKVDEGLFDYGVYAYYKEYNDLVRYCPPFWHRVVSIASNSTLLTDPKGKLSWLNVCKIFGSTTVAVAGCSVGNSIIHTLMMDIRPSNIKIADKSLYKMENINRVRLQYRDLVLANTKRHKFTDTLLRNKAEVTASQIYAIDPYVNVFVYCEGITADTVDTFLSGDSCHEPSAQIVIEEIDDPRMKIFLREKARKKRIPLIMATDIGSAVQLDILRYDLNAKLSLTYGMTDSELYQHVEAVYSNPGDRKLFFRFVDALLGKTYRCDELAKIIQGRSEIPTSTMIPQLGSTSAMAGALVAETVARIRLGHNYPQRIIINKRNFSVKILVQ